MIRFIDEQGMISPRGENIGADVAVTTFSAFIFDVLLEQTGAKKVSVMHGSVDIPVYLCEVGGKKIALYQTPIGAPAAVSALEEAIASGIKKVVAFGICGALTDIPPHEIVVPIIAFRDEGTSYHYMPATESVAVKNSGAVNDKLNELGIKTAVGGVWTTDGFYRETRTRKNEMLANGCIAVDMECSALQACANYRGAQFYAFFITADSLAGEEWEPNYILDLKATDSTAVAAAAAIRIAEGLGN